MVVVVLGLFGLVFCCGFCFVCWVWVFCVCGFRGWFSVWLGCGWCGGGGFFRQKNSPTEMFSPSITFVSAALLPTLGMGADGDSGKIRLDLRGKGCSATQEELGLRGAR